jgi:hypothetical protein
VTKQAELIEALCEEFGRGLKLILPEKLYGAYVYGAAAFPDDLPTGDIDFHVILTEPLNGGERSRLYEMHDRLAREYPPLGVDMDGYYILLSEARRRQPPRSQMWQRATDQSWALHRAHILAGRVIILRGPEPEEIYQPATWQELNRALQKELRYVKEHLKEYPGYSILQLCRLIYSYRTRDVVVSKAQAVEWARTALPEWKRHVELAAKWYAGRTSTEEQRFMIEGLEDLLAAAVIRIEKAKGSDQ